MSVVKVAGFWVNPHAVVGIWVQPIPAYHDSPEKWRAILRCEEGQVWNFDYDDEESAYRRIDLLAGQVNTSEKEYR